MAKAALLLLLGLAVTTALPKQEKNWPSMPHWWPDLLIPWPPPTPDFWPPNLPWPPSISDFQWPDRPNFWPSNLPWPPVLQQWPEHPPFWPQNVPWPPKEWPDKPNFWPDTFPWPPSIAQEWKWPERPNNWPDFLPWPPKYPDDWPSRPFFWPDHLHWPPRTGDVPWPESVPWQLPDIVLPWPQNPLIDDDNSYDPASHMEFHLFTRQNPSLSQPLVINSNSILANSNYRSSRNTVVLFHGARASIIDTFNTVLVPAFLTAADVNVIVVDWSIGAFQDELRRIVENPYNSGKFTASFLAWLVRASHGDLSKFHLVGHGIGALTVGYIGLKLDSKVGRVTALAPTEVHQLTRYLPPFSFNAGGYVEVIHSDIGNSGYAQPLGHADFYPNGGGDQPGCGGGSACNIDRPIFFFAESLLNPGSFRALQCNNSWRDAMNSCAGPQTLHMGGLQPNTGSRGVFFLRTNPEPPFSQS